MKDFLLAMRPLIISTLIALAVPIVGCESSKRVTVLKVYEGYGDYLPKDAGFVEKLCLNKVAGSISQYEFDQKYASTPVRIASGASIKYNVHGQIDDRYTEQEDYPEMVRVPSFVNGVAMDDGATKSVKKTRTVIRGSLRNVYAECTAFEYHL